PTAVGPPTQYARTVLPSTGRVGPRCDRAVGRNASPHQSGVRHRSRSGEPRRPALAGRTSADARARRRTRRRGAAGVPRSWRRPDRGGREASELAARDESRDNETESVEETVQRDTRIDAPGRGAQV